MTQALTLVERLTAIVGRRHVLTGEAATQPFRTGYRCGSGPAAAVVRPATLVQTWRVVQACVASDAIVIMQAANTGLTGGSTPDGDTYDRSVVIVNTGRMTGIHPIRGATQVVCLPGATLYDLEARLEPLGREPHSVIGSSCIGASVLGGVCNNSGGALVQRGPAYTEMALYARLDADGTLRLVNHLGIALGNDPEGVLERLEAGAFTDADVSDAACAGHASDYPREVRDVTADTPARYNADPRRLFEASGSAGRVIVFAVRLDTFAKTGDSTTFYLGTNDVATFTRIRRRMLTDFASLPVAAEYMHRGAFDIAARYGKDMFLAIERLGTRRLPALFRAKARIDALSARLPFVRPGATDRLMQRLGGLAGDHLPPRMSAYRDRYAHHLMIRMAGDGIAEARALLPGLIGADGDMFECSPEESRKAFLHRFVAAGAAVRYRAVHRADVADIVAIDMALPRNTDDWEERLPPQLARNILHTLYYGHFFCHVFHQDYIVAADADAAEVEHAIHALLDARGAIYPAEHNVGHLYTATPTLAAFYKDLDPCNQFNPGIGATPRQRCWQNAAAAAEGGA